MNLPLPKQSALSLLAAALCLLTACGQPATAPQASATPAATRSLTLKLNAAKLTAEQRAALQGKELDVHVVAGKAIPITANAPMPSLEQPPVFQKDFKLRLDDTLTVQNLPTGLHVSITANLRISAPVDLCGDSYAYADARSELPAGTVPSQPHELTLTVDRPSDLVCEKVTIQGQVRDTADRPVAGARVSIQAALPGSPYSGKSETLTDAEGRYQLPGIPIGYELEITVEKTGYTTRKRVALSKSDRQTGAPGNVVDFGGPANPASALEPA